MTVFHDMCIGEHKIKRHQETIQKFHAQNRVCDTAAAADIAARSAVIFLNSALLKVEMRWHRPLERRQEQIFASYEHNIVWNN